MCSNVEEFLMDKKKPNLAVALGRSKVMESVQAHSSENADMYNVQPNKQHKIYISPSREGKVTISGAYDPAVRHQLKQIALDNDTTIQQLLCEALNDLFQKYGKPPIAR
jgi:hypothetical protein